MVVISTKKSLDEYLHSIFPDEDITVPQGILSLWLRPFLLEERDTIEIEFVKGTPSSSLFRTKPFKKYKGLEEDTEYIKIKKRSVNEREVEYLNCARFMPVLEPIVPQYVGTAVFGEYSGLATSGTENKVRGQKTRNAWRYCNLRNRVVEKYARATNQAADEVTTDTQRTDVFNIALLHTCMYDGIHSEIFQNPKHSLLFSFDELEARASNHREKEALNTFRELRTRYEQAQIALEKLPLCRQGVTVIHFDPRPENIFDAPHGFRPIGDPEFAHVNAPEYDLARLFHSRIREYTQAYIFMRNHLEGVKRGRYVFDREAEVIAERVLLLHEISLIRTYSALLGRNDPDARKYALRLGLS